MGFFKKIGGFFGRLWKGAKNGIGKAVGFIKNKVLPIASKLKQPVETIGNIIAPGVGTGIRKGVEFAERMSGGGYG